MPVHGNRNLREAHDVAEDVGQERGDHAARLEEEVRGVPAKEAGVSELESCTRPLS